MMGEWGTTQSKYPWFGSGFLGSEFTISSLPYLNVATHDFVTLYLNRYTNFTVSAVEYLSCTYR
jgi:hypothetical protein